MTPEKQRIAIAEFCGWTEIAMNGLYDQYEGLKPNGTYRNRNDWLRLPDYLSDLNAMHEAENLLTDEQWIRFAEQLRNIILREFSKVQPLKKCLRSHSAKSDYRAEALLRCLEKWEDS